MSVGSSRPSGERQSIATVQPPLMLCQAFDARVRASHRDAAYQPRVPWVGDEEIDV